LISQTKIYAITEAATICGLSRTTLWRWIKSGKLQAYQTPSGQYKIRKEDLESFIRHDLPYLDSVFQEKLKRILIVDDEPSVRKLIKRMVPRDQYRIDEADNGLQAGLKIMKFNPVLIILDLLMPGIDGFETCRQIKSNHETRHIKIIILSGYDTPENREKAIELGADVFLRKPINKKKLLDSLKILLGG
jgi:excisionase family DNA binding protein